jgi:hypothetical protein
MRSDQVFLFIRFRFPRLLVTSLGNLDTSREIPYLVFHRIILFQVFPFLCSRRYFFDRQTQMKTTIEGDIVCFVSFN